VKKLFVEKLQFDWKIAILVVVSTFLIAAGYHG
jgi:hypothetical protein